MCAHGWLYDWQTLITGFLALLAGFFTVIAARIQVKAAQHQTDLMRDVEERRLASEAFAFHTMLEAAMGNVISDVEAARQFQISDRQPRSAEAYKVRTSIKRTGFSDLKNGLMRLGGSLAEPLLRLDSEIEHFASLVYTSINTNGLTIHMGENQGLSDHLDRIEQQANVLRYEAGRGMKLTCERLSKSQK